MHENKLVEVLKILAKYGLIDDTGHIHNCGYPDCTCAKMGEDLHEAIASRATVITSQKLHRL